MLNLVQRKACSQSWWLYYQNCEKYCVWVKLMEHGDSSAGPNRKSALSLVVVWTVLEAKWFIMTMACFVLQWTNYSSSSNSKSRNIVNTMKCVTATAVGTIENVLRFGTRGCVLDMTVYSLEKMEQVLWRVIPVGEQHWPIHPTPPPPPTQEWKYIPFLQIEHTWPGLTLETWKLSVGDSV